MAFEGTEEELIRSYLLGELSEDELQKVEQRVMSDDHFAERVSIIEDSLVEDYIEGKLAGPDRTSFEKLLLSTPQGSEQVRFTQALKEYSSRIAAPSPVVKMPAHPRRTIFGAPAWALAAAALVLVMIGAGIWRAYLGKPEIDKGIAALNRAFEKERPLDARITLLTDYAFKPKTRGGERDKVDSQSLRLAELILFENAEKEPDSNSLHKVGCYYLATRDFDAAIVRLNAALSLDPKSARIHSDLGAAYFEKGKGREERDPSGAREDFSLSLRHFSEALELDPELPAALFNRALLYQHESHFDQAVDEWNEYLKRDSSSSWADEAKKNIKDIADDRKKRSSSESEGNITAIGGLSHLGRRPLRTSA